MLYSPTDQPTQLSLPLLAPPSSLPCFLLIISSIFISPTGPSYPSLSPSMRYTKDYLDDGDEE